MKDIVLLTVSVFPAAKVRVPEPVEIVLPLKVLAVISPMSLTSGAKDNVTAVVPKTLI